MMEHISDIKKKFMQKFKEKLCPEFDIDVEIGRALKKIENGSFDFEDNCSVENLIYKHLLNVQLCRVNGYPIDYTIDLPENATKSDKMMEIWRIKHNARSDDDHRISTLSELFERDIYRLKAK